jgi:hypothetical protein
MFSTGAKRSSVHSQVRASDSKGWSFSAGSWQMHGRNMWEVCAHMGIAGTRMAPRA